jgi:hypothetical protein
MALQTVRHISVGIERPYVDVYAFLAEPANFPRWAEGLGQSFKHLEGAYWIAETPLGRMRLRFTRPNAFGILDHALLPESGPEMNNPMRVIANGNGSEVVFTLFQRPGMSDEEFARDAAWVQKDLAALKALLEEKRDRT